MIKRINIAVMLILLSCILFGSVGETPLVSRQIDFAGMKLILTDGAMREIQKDVDALRSSQRHFQIQLDRISLYFPMIEKVLKEENVPDDFKYLCIQESGLISDAVSSAKAVGFWQFKDFTAREVGLRIDNRIDERKNIVSATRGAAKYLKRNNFQFDNWAYALSAYQAGLGGVRKYVDKKYNGAKKLPITKNSHWYLRKFLAHKIAFENEIGKPHSDGLRLIAYERGKGKDIVKIAKEFKVEDDFLQFYNKWIKYGKIPSDKKYVVMIPMKGRMPRLIAEEVKKTVDKKIEVPEEKIYPKEIKPGIGNRNSIKIKINGVYAIMASKNDDMASLSVVGGLSEELFMKYNDLGSGSAINEGEVYYLDKKRNRSDIGFHIARDNETLWSVSQRFGIKLKALAKKNRISIIDEIDPGQVLWLNSRRPKNIPIEYHDLTSNEVQIVAPSPPKNIVISRNNLTRNEPEKDRTNEVYDIAEHTEVEDTNAVKFVKTGKTHKVGAGETLWSISRKYGASIDEIRKWNDLTKYDALNIGKILFVKQPKLKEKKIPGTKIYIVKPGDTLYGIAHEHKMEVVDLMDLNGKKGSYLSAGEQLKVYKNN